MCRGPKGDLFVAGKFTFTRHHVQDGRCNLSPSLSKLGLRLSSFAVFEERDVGIITAKIEWLAPNRVVQLQTIVPGSILAILLASSFILSSL